MINSVDYNNLSPYAKFFIYCIVSILAVLIFEQNLVNYYLNYAIAAPLSFACLIFFAGAVRSGAWKNFAGGGITIIDILLFTDLAYNGAASFFSYNADAAVREMVYQTSFFSIYLVMRVIFSRFTKARDMVFKLFYPLVVYFVCQLLFTVFYYGASMHQDGRLYYKAVPANLLASFLIIAAAFALYFIVRQYLAGSNKTLLIFHCMIFILTGVSIVLTKSRGGMLGFAAASLLCAFIFFYTRKKTAGFIYTTAGLAVLIFLPSFIADPNFIQRLKSLFDTETLFNFGDRLYIWKIAARVWLQNPVFGSGPGTYSVESFRVSGISGLDAHNFILQKLCETGIAGTALYLAPFFLIIKKTVPALSRMNLSKEEERSSHALNFTVLFVITGVFTNAIFTPFYYLPLISFLIYIISAAGVSEAPASAVTAKKAGVSEAPASAVTAKKAGVNECGNKALFVETLKVISFSSLIYFIVLKTLWIFKSDAQIVFHMWLKQVVFAVGAFIVIFNYDEEPFKPTILDEPGTPGMSAGKFKKLVLPLFFIIVIFFTARGFFVYAAEVANRFALVEVINKNSASGALKYLDISIKNSSEDPVYLLNKSNCLIFSELVKPVSKRMAGKVEEALVFSGRANKKYGFIDLIKKNHDLILGIGGSITVPGKHGVEARNEIMKYIENLSAAFKDIIKTSVEAAAKKIASIFPGVSDETTSIAAVKYFIFKEDSALKDFGAFKPNMKEYLFDLVEFSKGRYEFISKKYEAYLEDGAELDGERTILLSWSYYKAARFDRARETIYRAMTGRLRSKWDIAFKENILFSWRMEELIYPPPESFLTGYVFMALYRMNDGDLTRACAEILNYSDAILYSK